MRHSCKRSLLILALALTLFALPALAQKKVFTADPAQSKVEFTLGDVLHTVHGTFKLKSGSITFDEANGSASGEMVIDADSGDSGSGMRDRKMKKDILETQKYPDITFTAQSVKGKVLPQGESQVQVEGIFTLHGASHPLTISVQVKSDPKTTTSADTRFVVPYVKWGLKNPSTLFLKVKEQVDIDVHAVGQISPAP